MSVLGAEKSRTLVEVGAGVGATSWRIAQGRTYLGFEPDPESYAVAVGRLNAVADATIRNSLVPSNPEFVADAVVAFEVLEHVEDDRRALEDWIRWIREGGVLLLSVPAHQHRFGPMDTAVGHWRRYDREELEDLLRAAGLVDIEVRAYGMPAGYILEWVRNRMLARRLDQVGREEGTGRSGRAFQPTRWSRLLAIVMAPFVLIQKPFAKTKLGIGWVAWGRRPS